MNTAALSKLPSQSAEIADETFIAMTDLERALEIMIQQPKFAQGLQNVLAKMGLKVCQGNCNGACAIGATCTVDTRLSYSRKTNLMRQKGGDFSFSANMPLTQGNSAVYTIPPYKLGRVIECFYFRPKMADLGNPDDIKVEIMGEDNVLWSSFRGGRHMSQGCCLLDSFNEDCIGWDEGFKVRLEHTGPVGSPPLLSAAADWRYLFPGQKSAILPDWCWPKGRSCGGNC